MEDVDTPRSSRSGRKKSSALARLAAKKRSNQGSDDNASDFGSRSSLGGLTPRSSNRTEPHRNLPLNDSSDDDEDKVQRWKNELGANSYSKARYTDKQTSGYHGNTPNKQPRAINGRNEPQQIRVSGVNGSRDGQQSDSGNDDDGVRYKTNESHDGNSSDSDIEQVNQLYVKSLSDTIPDPHDRANSEVDLRKRSRQLDNLHDPARMDKRTASLTQAEVEETLNRLEEEDSLAELRRDFLPPQRSHLSPTPASRLNATASGSNGYRSYQDRPWSARNDYSANMDMMSERSVTSTSALQQITTQRARHRSFLVGSANHGGSFLGVQELERFFPDRKLRVFVGTWNMAEIKQPPKNIDDFVHPESLDYICDIYAFGTQESMSNRREWELAIQESLGPQHVLYHSANNGALYLSIFIRRDLIWYCSIAEDAFVGTMTTTLRTKGGLGTCFTLFGTSFLFINSHLHAHEGNLKVRLGNVRTIVNQMNLPNHLKSGTGAYQREPDVTARFDNVFWCGDMNFRLEKEEDRTKAKIRSLEEHGNYEDMLEYDELYKAMALGEAFQKFSEGRIKFRPTYKYDRGTDLFDPKKIRIPSYTDRVLFRCKRKGTVVCLHYDSIPEVRVSDHKPVYGVYEVTLRPGRDNIQLSGGQFHRDIWKTAMMRRALRLDVPQAIKKHQKQSTVCTVQ